MDANILESRKFLDINEFVAKSGEVMGDLIKHMHDQSIAPISKGLEDQLVEFVKASKVNKVMREELEFIKTVATETGDGLRRFTKDQTKTNAVLVQNTGKPEG
eukprot:CAMPEP_0116992464 /NCGR_PEP_ID=MMETSP0467-20121206/66813_1 /TAXON_ID=283647 /ORGANISM="Mesodinium pulex, Strain SPMC105" /LENGTH=102 /DNA_ID=CAMNT_0004689871 /DNA_START=923 /DNA_END=1231 /DNA_ORIENTATION=+